MERKEPTEKTIDGEMTPASEFLVEDRLTLSTWFARRYSFSWRFVAGVLVRNHPEGCDYASESSGARAVCTPCCQSCDHYGVK